MGSCTWKNSEPSPSKRGASRQDIKHDLHSLGPPLNTFPLLWWEKPEKKTSGLVSFYHNDCFLALKFGILPLFRFLPLAPLLVPASSVFSLPRLRSKMEGELYYCFRPFDLSFMSNSPTLHTTMYFISRNQELREVQPTFYLLVYTKYNMYSVTKLYLPITSTRVWKTDPAYSRDTRRIF